MICAYKLEGKRGTGISLGSALDARPHLGPVGHLLTQLGQVVAKLDIDFNIHHEMETDVHINATPWQQIRPQIEGLAR